jgi:hypothetical protein
MEKEIAAVPRGAAFAPDITRGAGAGRSEEGYMTRYLAGAMAITIGSNTYTGLK